MMLIDPLPTIGLDTHKKKKKKDYYYNMLDFKFVKSRVMMISMSMDAIYTEEIVKREKKNKHDTRIRR